MSDPRHAMIFECSENRFWLNIVPSTELPDDTLGDDSPLAAKTFGPFKDVDKAKEFADDNFENTGFEIPLYVDKWREGIRGY